MLTTKSRRLFFYQKIYFQLKHLINNLKTIQNQFLKQNQTQIIPSRDHSTFSSKMKIKEKTTTIKLLSSKETP
jgi:hypothetical protein